MAPSRRLAGFAGLVLASGLTVALEVLAVGRALHATSEGGSGAVETVFWVLVAMVTAMGAGTAVWQLILFGVESRHQVTVHEKGLALHHGRRSRALPWSEVTQVLWEAGALDVRTGALSDVRSLWLELPQGRHLVLSRRYTSFAVLVDAVVHETSADQLPRLRERLRVGKSVEFGPWKLSRTGLHTGTGWQPWNVVGGLVLGADGTLVLRSRMSGSELGRVKMSDLPDVHLLAPVLAEKVEASALPRRRSNPAQQGMRALVPDRV